MIGTNNIAFCDVTQIACFVPQGRHQYHKGRRTPVPHSVPCCSRHYRSSPVPAPTRFCYNWEFPVSGGGHSPRHSWAATIAAGAPVADAGDSDPSPHPHQLIVTNKGKKAYRFKGTLSLACFCTWAGGHNLLCPGSCGFQIQCDALITLSIFTHILTKCTL